MSSDIQNDAGDALAQGKDPITLLLAYLRKELATEHLDEFDAIHSAGRAVVILLSNRPEAVKSLAHKKLNVFPFKDVPLCWRRAFEDACLWQLLQGLDHVVQSVNDSNGNELVGIGNASGASVLSNIKESFLFKTWIDESITLCDQAIIFTGTPQRRSVIDTVLEWIEIEGMALSSEISDSLYHLPTAGFGSEQRSDSESYHKSKRRRLVDRTQDASSSPTSFLRAAKQATPLLRKEREIMREYSPSLSKFEKHVQDTRTPLVLSGALSHWPATRRWGEPRYWLQRTHGGKRLVPVELGKSYTSEGWGQRIMTFKDFLQHHLLHDRSSTRQKDNVTAENTNQNAVGYLAQHDLFSQIPALRSDIAIPDYCYVDTPESVNHIDEGSDPRTKPAVEPQLNIWLGPAETVSPAHTDPHHNILAQVFGRKYVRLFAPSQTDKMYPMTQPETKNEEDDSNVTQSNNTTNYYGVDMGNTSSVDVGAFVSFSSTIADRSSPSSRNDEVEGSSSSPHKTEREKFPLHASAEFVETILEAGECLYIPKGWWHYIRSLEPSCNVSFWWD